MRAGALVVSLTMLLLSVIGCGEPGKPELWIYTSIYNDVLDELKPQMQKQLPGVTLRWYAAGSEEVAARVTAELAGGGTRADVLMTADIFWYDSLRQDNHLLPLPPEITQSVPESLRDPDGRYVSSRAAAMIMVVNDRALGGVPPPASYADLVRPEYKGKVVIGDPLKSGTHFVAMALLSRKLGWEWYRQLRHNEVVIEGGNSAVLRKIETGDRPVGILLLENWLKAKQGGSTTRLVVPKEGAVVIPSPIAVVAQTKKPQEALAFCRLMMERTGQESMVRGRMYPVIPGLAGPPGAPPFAQLLAGGLFPDPKLIREVSVNAEELKETFVTEMLE